MTKPESCLFGIGEPNDGFAQHFTGRSYLNPLTDGTQTMAVFNVTFEPGCRNDWHVHMAEIGGGQILLCTDGRGWCQFWGEEPRSLSAGDVIFIPAGVKHWHGAAKDSWFSHVAFDAPGEKTGTEWMEPVSDEQYEALPALVCD